MPPYQSEIDPTVLQAIMNAQGPQFPTQDEGPAHEGMESPMLEMGEQAQEGENESPESEQLKMMAKLLDKQNMATALQLVQELIQRQQAPQAPMAPMDPALLAAMQGPRR
jgi:hypothetical protein